MIRVQKVLGLATVQDLGRVGHASEAVPRGGALSRRRLRDANASLGNAPGAACIEVIGRLVLRAEANVAVATELGDVTALHAGDDSSSSSRAPERARGTLQSPEASTPLAF